MEVLKVEDVMHHLVMGGKVAPKEEKGFRGFYVDISENNFKTYIHYNHFGSSAVTLSYKNLEWLINEIFGGIDKIELKEKDYYVYA